MKKQLIGIISFIAAMLISWQLVRFVVVDDNASTRLSFHEFYAQDKIDAAAVGTSRAHCGFVPQLADELLGMNTFNLSTQSQRLSGSYFVTKELLKRYDPKLLFFEVEYTSLVRGIDSEKAGWTITDYIKSPVRLEYINEAFETSRRPILLSAIYRYKTDIDPGFCLKNIRAKLQPSYMGYTTGNSYYTNYNKYGGKGWDRPGGDVKDGREFFAYKNGYSEFDKVDMDIPKVNLDYIDRAIELCRDEGCEIILFTAPQSELYLSQAGDYAAFVSYMEAFSRERGVRYYNTNLLADERFTDAEFRNLDHLNEEGSYHLTRVLCELYRDEGSHSFVSSLSDRDRSGVYGVLFDDEESGDSHRTRFKALGFDGDTYSLRVQVIKSGDTLYDSGLLADEAADYTIADGAYTEVYVYDESGRLLGSAKPRALSREAIDEKDLPEE